MGMVNGLPFNVDIVLDEEAFDTAVKDFEALEQQLANLREDVETMLSYLKEGFQTPAGELFISSCETHIFQPLDDQKKVIKHIKETLQQTKQSYESVFREYESLQTKINQFKKG